MADSFDLIILGGGPAGLAAADEAARRGATAALVDPGPLGGVHHWSGGVPVVALAASARAAHLRRDSGRLGILGKARPVDLLEVLAATRGVCQAAASPLEVAPRNGVTRVTGLGVLADHGIVDVGGRRLTARHIIVATGATPLLPAITGLDGAGCLTHRTIWDLESPLSALAVIGGGATGVELAHAFQRLGTPTILFEREPRLLPREDPDAAQLVAAVLAADGVTIETGVTITSMSRVGSGRTIHWRDAAGTAREVVVEGILLATGTRPRRESLGLETVGLADPAGCMPNGSLRAGAPGLWFAGDSAGGVQGARWAELLGAAAARNALSRSPRRFETPSLPRVIHTDPELAQVGPTAAEAADSGISVEVRRMDLAAITRPAAERREAGFVQLLVAGRSRLVGATIVSPAAGELAGLAALAIRHRLPVSALDSGLGGMPGMAEALARAAGQAVGP